MVNSETKTKKIKIKHIVYGVLLALGLYIIITLVFNWDDVKRGFWDGYYATSKTSD